MIPLYSKTNRILHWLIFFTLLVLAYTETMNTIFYSKEAIMKTFEFSFSALGYQDIPPLDRLFIARLERRDSWMVHYYAGIVFVVLSFARFLMFMLGKQKRYAWLHVSLFAIIVTQFITGYSLWAYPHIYAWQNITRAIHHYSIWALYGVVGLHIAKIIYGEVSGRSSGVVSKMIGGLHDSEQKKKDNQ